MLSELILGLSLLAIPSTAQLNFAAGELPSCAQSCMTLINAQTACAPAGSQIHVCFCQSAYLTANPDLHTSYAGICADTCPQSSEQQQIQTWFLNYCNNNVGGASSSGAAAASTASGAPAATESAASATTSTNSLGDSSQSNTTPPTWWDVHARWIAMVIVIVIAFAIIIVLGVWYKRRHDRKVNRGTIAPLPAGWGPNADPHSYPPAMEKPGRTPHTAAQTVQNAERGQRHGRKAGTLRKLIGK